MRICLRRTIESDLDFVLDAEQSSENREFVIAWTREQHRAAYLSEDLRHLVIENFEGRRVGYIILAGLTDVNQIGEGVIWVAFYKDEIINTVSVVAKKDLLYIRSMAITPGRKNRQLARISI